MIRLSNQVITAAVFAEHSLSKGQRLISRSSNPFLGSCGRFIAGKITPSHPRIASKVLFLLIASLLLSAQPADAILNFADVILFKADDATFFEESHQLPVSNVITYILVAYNLGPSKSRNVEVTDYLPTNVQYISSTEGCVYDPDTHQVTCDYGDLAAGDGNYSVIEVLADEVGSITNRAILTSTTSDFNPGNNDTNYVMHIMPGNTNYAPVLSAWAESPVALASSSRLEGQAIDDGNPAVPGVTTTQWTQVSGPGIITFEDESLQDTRASFSTNGEYVLQFTAYDGELFRYHQVNVTVTAETPPLQPTKPPWERVFDATVDGRYTLGAYSGGFSKLKPALADIDGDGDQDLMTGSGFVGFLTLYENVGNANDPRWSVTADEVKNNSVYSQIAPTLVDIDGDGDLDLFQGRFEGVLDFYENTGTATHVAWAVPNISYAGIDVGSLSMPSFEDLDGDNDKDLLIGSSDGTLTYYENTGTISQAAWAAPVYNYHGIGTITLSTPALCDMDADGDTDLLLGSGEGGIAYYENTGNATNAAWAGPFTNFAGTSGIKESAPTVADVDGDNDVDILVGTQAGEILLFENVGSPTNPSWASPVEQNSGINVKTLWSWPAMADLDADSDFDMMVGDSEGGLTYFENVGSPSTPFWESAETNTLAGAVFSASPTFCDIDADGDLDLFHGGTTLAPGCGSFCVVGTIDMFENTGTPSDPQWAAPEYGFMVITQSFGLASYSPAFADIDNDDDYDMFVGLYDGTLSFYENIGSSNSPAWAAVVTNYADFDVAFIGDAEARFVDIDGDGDQDVFFGTENIGHLVFYENTGTVNNAAWAPAIVNYQGMNILGPPSFADIDGDGDEDMIVGHKYGGIKLYRNGATKLQVSPPALTLVEGETNTFSLAEAADVTWSLVDNRSGGSINSTNGQYVAGTNAPAIDVVLAVDTNGTAGRSHVNVIRTEDVASFGKAIIVAGAKSADDPVWDATDLLADKAFLTLRHRGFSKNNIQYLSFDPDQDVDGDGALDDIDESSTLANASTAFSTFAQNADKLFVYLVDHGSDSAGQGFMRLNPTETLSATQLDTWLDALQTADTNLQITVAMDFCYAGSFLDELTNALGNRTIIASTADDELTYFIAGGLVSFSDAFFTTLQLGYGFNNAFLFARDAMSAYQLAQLDDNGDGIYQKSIDGAFSTNGLGASFIAGLDIPQIGMITPNQVMTTGTTVTIWADAISSVYPLERVWCSIVPPGHNPDTDSGVPVLDIPELDLLPDADDPGRYETTFEGFTEPGTYKVMFFAQDIWGSLSLAKQSYITQSGFEERTILVLGGESSDLLWSNMNYIANNAYNTLLSRLFTHDTIYYMNDDLGQDLDGDGTNDVDALPSINGLSNAIAAWALSADKLNIFLVGTGSNNALRLSDTETLNVQQFDAWLDDYQAADHSVNLVLDFSGSGGFATNLVPPSGKERINIASTRPYREAIMGEGGLVSFSQYFLSGIFSGLTIGDASVKARRTIRRASGHVRQRAGIDDDGDGLLNEKNVDGVLAKTRYIGAAFVTGDDIPNIASVIPLTALTNDTQLTIWASGVTDVDGISNVWCVITPPEYDGVSALPALDLSYSSTNNRYEALYAGFTEPGYYVLTFYASDNLGEISAAVQSEVIKKDRYEVDDTLAQSALFNTESFQVHTFHDDGDVDWIMFYAYSDYAYDIETFHLSTNIDTILDLYKVLPDGTLTNLDHLDDFGFDEGELTGLDFPEDGLYYLKVSQFITNGAAPGAYELIVEVPAGESFFVIGGINLLTLDTLPDGSYAQVNGVNYPFGSTNKIKLNLAPGTYTVGVVSAESGFLALEDKNIPNQSLDMNDTDYGNPRVITVGNVDDGAPSGLTAFWMVPHVTVAARVRDQWTGLPISSCGISFSTTNGYYSENNGFIYDGYPFYANYKSNWVTQSDGTFPGSVLIPATNSDLALAVAGYPAHEMDGAVAGVDAGDVVDLGDILVAPTDTNANLIADAWEALYFGAGSNVNANADDDLDGVKNRDEYRVGTDPTDINDTLEYDTVHDETGGLMLTWPVKAGRTYRVMYSDNLIAGDWQLGGGPWEAGTGQTAMQWTDTEVDSVAARCYRIEVLLPGL